MKKFLLFAAIIIALVSCQKEEISPVMDESSSSTMDQTIDPSLISSESTDSVVLKATGMTEYQVSPKFGKPNSTYYNFKVYDVAGTLSLSVKLYDKATGTITYLPMTKTGGYWLLSTRISSNGWYDYRYVYSLTKNPISTTTSYQLCNSKNVFSSSGTSAISWPFGADGSSWSNRTINGQMWKGGQECREQGGSNCAFGWNVGTHTGTTEQYSDDWNRGTGTQDNGAIIRSPLDGYIETIGQYYVSGYGYSKYVSVIQQGADGNLYRFYVAHLQNTASGLYAGKYIRAGIDQIGTLGSTGASSPHAHTNMRVNGASVRFYFNAQ